MFIKNTTNKDIKLTSFEGFEFSAPPGVSAIWDQAGKHLISTHAPMGEYGKFKGKDFIPQEPPTPGIIEATKEEWVAGGKRMTQANRFQVSAGLIPRQNLLEIATKRGVPLEKIQGNVTDDEILQAINELPVPDEIRYPHINDKED